MKKIVLVSIIVLLFQLSHGQDTISKIELGSTLVTVNNFSDDHFYYRDRPAVEYLNGLFFRYTYKRISFRVLMSYSENYYSYSDPPSTRDGSSGDASNKDVRLGIGGQFSVFKKNSLLYPFIDASYRNIFSTGHYYGGFGGANDERTSTTEGLLLNIGIGSKIKIYKSIYLSPEIAYSYFNGLRKETSTYVPNGSTIKYSSQTVYWSPLIKLHLTVNF